MRLARVVAMVIVMGWCAWAGAAAMKEPSAAEVAKMEAAAPAKARVAPQTARKVLVFSLSWGYKHDAIPYGKKVFQILGQKTRAYEAVVSDDTSMFEPRNLAQFDAVIFNNTNEEIFLPENFEKLTNEAEIQQAKARDELLKKSLVEWLASGKGLLVIHAGVASFRQWLEYGNIIGARFENHPWVSGSTVALKVDEPRRPLAAAFEGWDLKIRDEIYQVTDPYSRENLRVILSIDTSKTDMKKQGIVRKDGDFAMSWIKSYGKGRVFYNAFGHDHDIYWNPVVLQHWLDGVQFVVGDLPADVTPSAKVER